MEEKRNPFNLDYLGSPRSVSGSLKFVWLIVGLILLTIIVISALGQRTATQSGKVIHRVLPGEKSLRTIAAHYYKDPRQWQKIFMANREALQKNKELFAGQELIIPDCPLGSK